MSKAKLVEQIATDAGMPKTDAERAVDAVFGAVGRLVEQGERVQIRGFGNFQMKDRAGRMGRNPSTGEPLPIGPKRVLAFKDMRR